MKEFLNKNKITIFLIVILLISIFINFKQYEKIKENKINNINNGIIFNNNKILLDSINKENNKNKEYKDSLLVLYNNKINNVKIITKYKTVYEKIKNNTSDSSQYVILLDLLKRSREIEFKRN